MLICHLQHHSGNMLETAPVPIEKLNAVTPDGLDLKLRTNLTKEQQRIRSLEPIEAITDLQI